MIDRCGSGYNGYDLAAVVDCNAETAAVAKRRQMQWFSFLCDVVFDHFCRYFLFAVCAVRLCLCIFELYQTQQCLCLCLLLLFCLIRDITGLFGLPVCSVNI